LLVASMLPSSMKSTSLARKRGDVNAVFALTERGERTYWTRVGSAFTNRDGSITCKLDALPVSGTLQIRDEEPRHEREPVERSGKVAGRSGSSATTDTLAGHHSVPRLLVMECGMRDLTSLKAPERRG